MQTVGIDIGTTTISGVVLEKNGTQKPRILKAKTIENGSFLRKKVRKSRWKKSRISRMRDGSGKRRVQMTGCGGMR